MGGMKSGIICHGDCDGVISAFIYIKHYLMDSYPRNVEIVFTQPWRAQIDSRKLSKDVGEVVVLDLALSEDFVNFLENLLRRSGSKVVVIDHHMSSKEFVGRLNRDEARVIWGKAPSTPRLMLHELNLTVNPYEQLLIEVADVCEGSESKVAEAVTLADMIKLSIARDPGDLKYLNHLVSTMLKGADLSKDPEIIQRAKIAKFLLRRLLRIMSERSVEVRGVKLIPLDLSESRIYAGLLGIASTEFAKMSKRDVVLIRREEGKVVVTVRSVTDRALRICKKLAEELNGKHGGHNEAASATLPDLSLKEAFKVVLEVVKSVPRENPLHK